MGFFILLLASFTLEARTLNLTEVYKTALTNTEVMKRSQARLEQAQERKSQATGAIMPAITLRGTYTEIDPPKTSGVSSAFTRTDQYNAAINITQPVFRGLRDFAFYRQAKTNVLLNQYLKDYSQITLYQSVINAYYNLLLAQKDYISIQTLHKYSEDRTRELKERTSIGRSRRGELLQAEAQVANALAAMTDAESLVIENKAALAFFLNDNVPGDYELGQDSLPASLQKIDYYLSRAYDRPDLKAKMADVEATESSISIARGNHLPSIDVFGNYYLTRTGVLGTSDWDMGVTFSMPLFQGGIVNSQVSEAVARKNEMILNHQENKREIERDVTMLYESVNRSLKQMADLGKALKKTEDTYKENLKDYRYGLVTNLDVILALNTYVETKRNYDRLEMQTIMNYKNLEAIAGVLP